MPRQHSKKPIISFQEKVYRIVSKIPRGKVLSYKGVAEKSGFPGAWRAVGNILNKNKNPRIPCHRVIKSNGQVGGYRRGTKRKASLLTKEGVVVKNQRVVFDKTEGKNDRASGS